MPSDQFLAIYVTQGAIGHSLWEQFLLVKHFKFLVEARQLCFPDYILSSQTNRNDIYFRFFWKKTIGKGINDGFGTKTKIENC